jgi:3-dehydroquinate synthase
VTGKYRLTEIDLPGYRVTISNGALGRARQIIERSSPAHRYALISDTTVAGYHAARLRDSFGEGKASVSVHTIEPGEHYKTRDTWARLTDELLAGGAGRDTTILALGGGVVGDLAGFVAATFMRGIPVVQLPTTLLAMVDASVGGKTGVDTPAGKNLVGAFHPPSAVVIDPSTLSTLPSRQLRAGIAEVLKHGIISDADYFEQVQGTLSTLVDPAQTSGDAMHDVIARSVAIKAAVVADDEREAGRRKILNFGHTIGHAVELLSGFSLLHGEAVAIGMALEAALAERLGVAEKGTAVRVKDALARAGLPVSLPSGMLPASVVSTTHGDKKARRGAVEYALPTRVGSMASLDGAWSVPVPDAEVLAALG